MVITPVTFASIPTQSIKQGDQILFDNSGVTRKDTIRNILNKTKRISDADATSDGIETSISYITLTAPRTFTLRTADTILDQIYLISDESGTAGTFPITITTEGGQRINGAANITITVNYGYVKVRSDGNNWFIIGGI